MNSLRYRYMPAIALWVFVLSCFVVPARARETPEKINGLYQATFKGSPFEIGLAHGKLFRNEIQKIYSFYLDEFVYENWTKKIAMFKGKQKAYADPRKDMEEFAAKSLPLIPDEYIEEMKGMAEGSGVSLAEILNMTVHVDYLSTMMCSMMLAKDKASADGSLVQARNLDWGGDGLELMDQFTSVLVYKPDKGYSFVSVIYPGIVGALTAVNEKKLTVELNFVATSHKAASGFPALLMVRRLAQYAASVDEAEKIIRDNPMISGYNITVADGKTGEARVFEISADALGVRTPDATGALFSTNHFLTKELADYYREGKRPGGIPSADRYNRMAGLVAEKYGAIGPDAAQAIIHDPGVKVGTTVQSVIFKPADEIIWVWSRNRAPGDFVQFDVKKLLAD